ncbi:MAG: alanine--tRNA ligase [Trueperaceae bacterium]|nr:MAG: alanine--tRNA ligase [Trueperaceae bacterium]
MIVETTELDIDKLRRKYLEFFEAKTHLAYPSASLKSDDPTLMFTSAGMVQFKPYFLGATPKFAGYQGVWHRVTTAQKCLRINDIENVGRTLRHHSFFEMLGNFSFGDYFKREASAWAWEFMTSNEWLGLDPERLYVTIYTDDDEAFEVWTEHVGVPADRISRWGEDENFWPANAVTEGPNGPCGPCSEIFYDRGPEFGTPDETGPNTGSGDRFVEVWNLVFTQFDRQEGGVLEPLPQQNIDTGLGFERLVAVMTGAEDAYSTPLFLPTIERVAELTAKAYQGTQSVSHRVIADHVRAITFAITDGVMPANDGAGYVVKMLLRRASRHAWLLGLREPVLHALVDQVITAMGSAYPELIDGRERVKGIIRTEEEQFLRTLEAGIQRVAGLLDELEGRELSGRVAFDLWQTYGFPLDLTQEMAAERGISVDSAGYEAAREEARAISRGSGGGGPHFISGKDMLGNIADQHGETTFCGYTEREADAEVLALIGDDELLSELTEQQTGRVVLDPTPYYPEGGGQIGDSGKLEWQGGGALVTDTTRSPQGLTLHQVKVLRGTLLPGQRVRAVVDPSRSETEKHHTATHLLHAALRSVLGSHVAQAGSLVAPDRLRFDFSHPAALRHEEIEAIEGLVNRWIQADFTVSWQVVGIAEARAKGAMMLFGEKYGDDVRMVTVGEDRDPRESVSIELCGGTHVGRTGEIGSLLIVSEEAVSAGVRRVEALAGTAAIDYVQKLRGSTSALAYQLGVKPDELSERIGKLQTDLKSAQRDISTLRDRLAAAQTTGATPSELREAGGFSFTTALLDGIDAGALRKAADNLLQQSQADLVVLGSGTLLVAKVGPSGQARGAHAGTIIRELAKRAGGGGGGRPDMAQAGVKDPNKLQEAFSALPEILTEVSAS